MGPGSAMGGAHGRRRRRRHPTAPGRRTGCWQPRRARVYRHRWSRNTDWQPIRLTRRTNGEPIPYASASPGSHHSASPHAVALSGRQIRTILEPDSHQPGDILMNQEHTKWRLSSRSSSHDPGTVTNRLDSRDPARLADPGQHLMARQRVGVKRRERNWCCDRRPLPSPAHRAATRHRCRARPCPASIWRSSPTSRT